MYEKVLAFVKYNNAFTLILVIFFLGSGITFAASPKARDGIYSSQETLVSVDNAAIISADLGDFDFDLVIESVTEDDENYHVTYSYETFLVEDGVWQDKGIEKTLKVNREALAGNDLGLYVAKELSENINYELSYLARAQKLERDNGESRKVVTVQYSGLVGKLLNPKEKIFEGYDPVIKPIKPEASVIEEPELVPYEYPKSDEPPLPDDPPPIDPPPPTPGDDGPPVDPPPPPPVDPPPIKTDIIDIDEVELEVEKLLEDGRQEDKKETEEPLSADAI